jgi:hypothetical protein
MNELGLEMLNYEILGNSLLAWLTSVALLVLVWAALAIVRRVVRKRMKRYAGADAATALQIARDVVSRTTGWFLLLVAVLVASRVLASTPWIDLYIPRVVTVGLVLYIFSSVAPPRTGKPTAGSTGK